MSAPIIITVPNNYLALDDMEIESKVVVDVASPAPSRKRRLDHLTWEEKMQRKKLKNRVAAQTSRDRKKAKMDEMESRIKYVSDMNERLTSEIASLKALNERLLSENASLRSEAAARTVAGAPRPAESDPQQKEGPPAGDPRGSPAAGDVSPLADLLAQFDSDEYLTTLNQLAESLLKEIDANTSGTTEIEPVQQPGECLERTKMVGTTTEHLESNESSVTDMKHDVNRILLQHSYAYPYKPDIVIAEHSEQIKEENNDKGDIFYASCEEASDGIEVPCEETILEDIPLHIKTDLTSLMDCSELKLECDMKMLSPMTMSSDSVDENLILSPSHTNLSSDLGYESLASPLSESEPIDLPDFCDFWCESYSELFPGLA